MTPAVGIRWASCLAPYLLAFCGCSVLLDPPLLSPDGSHNTDRGPTDAQTGEANPDQTSTDCIESVKLDGLRCDSGEPLAPCRSFNATASENKRQACNAEGFLREGLAGLDYFGNGEWTPIDGEEPTGCIGLDFLHEKTVAEIVVRAQPADDACGKGCSPDYCDHSDAYQLAVFSGVEREALRSAGVLQLTSTELKTYTFQLARRLRYVVLCRRAWGEDGPDIAVDLVFACIE